VPVEAPILDREHRERQVRRQLGDADPRAVDFAVGGEQGPVGGHQRDRRSAGGGRDLVDLGQVVGVPGDHAAEQHQRPDRGAAAPNHQALEPDPTASRLGAARGLLGRPAASGGPAQVRLAPRAAAGFLGLTGLQEHCGICSIIARAGP